MTDYVLLKVTSSDAESAVPVISKTLHSFDYIGYGNDGGLYILLTDASKERGDCLKAELSQNGIGFVISEETKL